MRIRRAPNGLDYLFSLHLTEAGADPRWEEQTARLGDQEQRRRVAPPQDRELLRYHPAAGFTYQPLFADENGTWANDLTRVGLTVTDYLTHHAAWVNSLWVYSYYADAEGQQLLSRNYLGASSSWAHLVPVTASPVWQAELDQRPHYPALEHAVVYAPADARACWLELRLVLARGGRQLRFTTRSSGTQPGLVSLTLDPERLTYALASGLDAQLVYELVPVQARRTEAPVLNAPAPSRPRYDTDAGGPFQPTTITPDFR